MHSKGADGMANSEQFDLSLHLFAQICLSESLGIIMVS